MRTWRKVYASLLDSDDVGDLSDGALNLFFLLIIAQDDEGAYPWTASKIKRLTVTREWTPDQTDAFLQEIIGAGIATRDGNYVVLSSGAALNGQLRSDREKDVYRVPEGAPPLPISPPLVNHRSAADIPAVSPEERRGEESKKRVREDVGSGSDILTRYSSEQLTELTIRFPGIDLKWEADKCFTWHSEKGRPIKRPQSAFNNWISRATPNTNGKVNADPAEEERLRFQAADIAEFMAQGDPTQTAKGKASKRAFNRSRGRPLDG